MSPSTMRNKTRGRRIRCRFRSLNAHAEQERSEPSRSLKVRRRLLQPMEFSHLENSAKVTDIPTSGQVVRNHDSLKMADEHNAARKTTFPSLSLVYRLALPAQLHLHAKKCVERYCELANKTNQQLYKVATPCLDDHKFKEEELGSVGELSKVYSQIVLKCLYLARIGRLDILWSVNKLARSITKWTKACDKRLNRLISYIFITRVNTNSIVMWEIPHNNADCDYFRTLTFAGDLEDSKSTSGGTLCVFGSHTFVPISWMCEQTVRRNLKLFLLTQVYAWMELNCCKISFNQTKKSKEEVQGELLRDKPSRKHTNTQPKTRIQHNDFELCNVDYVSSKVKSSHSSAMRYIFEDSETAIKMSIKGRSPTMRHVS